MRDGAPTLPTPQRESSNFLSLGAPFSCFLFKRRPAWSEEQCCSRRRAPPRLPQPGVGPEGRPALSLVGCSGPRAPKGARLHRQRTRIGAPPPRAATFFAGVPALGTIALDRAGLPQQGDVGAVALCYFRMSEGVFVLGCHTLGIEQDRFGPRAQGHPLPHQVWCRCHKAFRF